MALVPPGLSKKLYQDPFRSSDVTYRIADVQAKRHRQVVHFDRLKLCPPDIRLPSDQQPSQPPTSVQLCSFRCD